MSSTFTRLQAPAHTHNHPATEPPQPYSNHQFSSYSADFRAPANADSYARTEDLYDPGYGYSYGLESSQSEEPDEAVGYGPMQSYSYASPQPLSPRPTLPPSQFSHFSWHDWPSDAPANTYQAERSRYTSTSSLPHLPQAGEIHHSSGNQQFISNPLASNYVGDGYTQPPSISSFDQSPSRSTHFNIQSGFYYSAHQPVLPEQRSSYSELAPNLKFMNSQTQPPLVHKKSSHSQDFSRPKTKYDDAIGKGTISSLDVEKNPFALGFDGPPLTAFGRKVPLHASSLPVPIPVPLYPSKTSDYIS